MRYELFFITELWTCGWFQTRNSGRGQEPHIVHRDPRYQELAHIANPLISGVGWEGISGKNYIGPRNISEIRAVVESSVSESEPVIGVGEPPAWYSDQQVSQEPGQTTGFDYNDEVVRDIV